MTERMTAEDALAQCAAAVAQAAAAAVEAAKIATQAHAIAAEAMRVGTIAHSNNESHEKLCALREEHREEQRTALAEMTKAMHVENRKDNQDVKDSIRRLYGVHWKVAGFIIVLLLGCIGFLIVNHGL